MEFELNDFEQYSRNNSIRIYNLAIKNNDSTSTVLKLLKDKLEIQLSASDIVAAHPLPPNFSSSNRDPHPPPPIIVHFLKNTTKGLVIQNRRKLKGNTSKTSIHEDLTRKNMLLLNRVKRDDRISAAWSSRGLIWCMLKKSKVKFNVRLFKTIDGALSRSNPGAGGGPRVVVSTAAFHARVRGSVPGLGGLKETKMFLPHPRVKVSIVGSLRDREVACSASDRQGSNFESCVWRTVSSQSSHQPQEVLLAQFSLYVHKGGLKPDSFHFNPGAQRKSRLTQQARGATTTDSIATRLHKLAGMSPPAGTPLLSSTPNENMNDTPAGGN